MHYTTKMMKFNEEEFGKDYTIGNFNINDLDDLDEEADDTALGLEPNENEEQEIGTNAEQSDENCSKHHNLI